MNRRGFAGARRRALLLGLAVLLTLGAATAMTAARAAVSHLPIGHVDRVVQIPGGFAISGWALDPDTRAPILVDVYADGRGLTRLRANQPRADVARRYPKQAGPHGFSARLNLAAGKHTICTYAINTGRGRGNPRLACVSITLNFSPIGKITSVKQVPGGVAVTGWTFDPDEPTTSLAVAVKFDTKVTNTVASLQRPDVAAAYPYAGSAHGFSFTTLATQGTHSVCVTAVNKQFGGNTVLPCATPVLNFLPTTAITGLTQTTTGARISGWGVDPDTSAPVTVTVTADGVAAATVVANAAGSAQPGHAFAAALTLGAGVHTVCITAKNLSYGGTGSSPPVCQNITLNFDPFGHFDRVVRESATSSNVVVSGWSIDPSTTAPISITVTIDGVTAGSTGAGRSRPDIGRSYPDYGALHGFTARFSANDKEHKVCAVAKNVGIGTDKQLGCLIIIAVHPVPPSAPGAVVAVGGFGGATLSWTPPASDGGAPWDYYLVKSFPGGILTKVAGTETAATVVGLKASTRYAFTVVAHNVAGTSPAGTSAWITTQAVPPPQTTPAPVSTSRYTRNIKAATPTDINTMRAEGYADAQANPSGHGYIILLDIGGQDQVGGGVVLSATTHFVSYRDLVLNLKAYVDGYHAGQRPSAPVVIAIGTNNDMDVTAAAGAAWARSVVNPIVAYAAKYTGLKIAGANDIEPGFRAGYAATRAWLAAYLGASPAPFVFNGSADGCAWTVTNRPCNNGWTMAGLYQLAGGLSPTRIINLPQIYNNTMAAQWKYISLTGVLNYSKPRINFGGALTEWTACFQARSCGSLTGVNAWKQMWSQLQSSQHLRVGSLPYSTDLRIDR